jgi:hypothetical protein
MACFVVPFLFPTFSTLLEFPHHFPLLSISPGNNICMVNSSYTLHHFCRFEHLKIIALSNGN